jgi:YesN/AraC family two-component response regulator
VDDEPNILSALKRLLRKEPYRVLTANDGQEALRQLSTDLVHIIISDQRMPGMSGTDLMAQVKDAYPDVLRIILTGYTDVDSITESINKGHIYKFFLKPWNDQNLTLEIRQALEQYDLIQTNRRLEQSIVEQNRQLKEMNEQLESLVKERTQLMNLQGEALQLTHAILEQLPLPVVGVDREAMIVMANQSVQAIRPVKIGSKISNYFPEQLEEIVLAQFDSGMTTCVQSEIADKEFGIAEVAPLVGRYFGKGAIITFPAGHVKEH